MVYLDTNILIYLLEAGPYSQKVASELERLRSEGSAFFSSVISITEFLAGTNAPDSKLLLGLPDLDFVDVDQELAKKAASLQRQHQISIGDSLHLASAVVGKAGLFFSNDNRLAKTVRQYMPVRAL